MPVLPWNRRRAATGAADLPAASTGERFELNVARERALHAFHHPFVYA